MTTTPTSWKPFTSVNTSDSGPFGDTQNVSKVVALANGRFLVVWTDDSGGKLGFPGLDVIGQVFDAFGRPVGNEFIASVIYNDLDQQLPDMIAFADGSFAVAYQTTDAVPIGDGENINVDYFDASGSFVSNIDLRQFDASGIDDRSPSIVALSNGDAAIVYEQSDNGAASTIVGNFLAGGAAGALISFETTSEATRSPDLAQLSTGSLIVSYERDLTVGPAVDVTQIWYSVRTSDGVLTQKLVASTDIGTAAHPVVTALPNGGFVIAWTDSDAESDKPGVVARYFSAPGVTGVEVLREISGADSDPTVTALSDGGFVLGWRDDASDSLKGQRFSASGQEIGTEFTVATNGSPSQPEFALLGDGRFVVSFTAEGEGDEDIFFTIFDPRTGPIVGTSAKDYLTSRIEGAVVQGLAGDDFLFGQAGSDTLEGGKGADYLSGGQGSDFASYSGATTGVIADLINPAVNSGDAAGDRYNSIERLIGSDFNDSLLGTSGANVMSGRLGNDTLNGRAGNDSLGGNEGNDVLIGGLGADYLSGGTGSDTASYAAATAGVVVSLTSPSMNTGEAAGDTYNSIERVTGSAFADKLYGANVINNVLRGGAGNDLLTGYTGNDFLEGGSGQDTFVFNTTLNASTNVDNIADFSRIDDTIQIDNAFFAAINVTGILPSGYFKNIDTGVVDANDHILYDQSTGELFYDSNGSAAGGRIKFAQLAANTAIAYNDFFVV